MELQFSSDSHQFFNCQTCRPRVKQLRKCQTNKENYTYEKDGNPWPMTVYKGGEQYGFCPGKAQWFPYLEKIYRIMATCCEMSVLPYEGGLLDQPRWFVDNIGWFSSKYKNLRAITRSGFGKIEKNPKTPKPTTQGAANGNKQRPRI